MAITYSWRYYTLEEISPYKHEWIDAILALDAKKYSTNPKSFIKRNHDQYELALNLWALLIRDRLGRNTEQLITCFTRERGLCETIRYCNNYSNTYICELTDKWCGLGCDSIEFTPLTSAIKCDGVDRFDNHSQIEILQSLRFLKRFSPYGMDALNQEKIDSFLKVNFEVETRDEPYWTQVYTMYDKEGWRLVYVSPTPYIGESVLDDWKPAVFAHTDSLGIPREKVKFRWLSNRGTADPGKNSQFLSRLSRSVRRDLKLIISDMLKGYKYNPEDDAFSNGASLDTCKCTFCKTVSKYLRDEKSPFIRLEYGSYSRTGSWSKRWSEAMANGERVRPLDKNGRPFYASRLALVPKDYKGPRIIAPEAQDKQEKMKGIAKALERALVSNGYGKAIPLHDQTINQNLAALGACNGITATIDSSHASDSNMKDLVYDIFPMSIVNDFISVMPSHINIEGKIYRLNMFGTMGSALTFIVESIVFYAIARLATEYALMGIKNRKRFRLLLELIKAYGDDIIVPSVAYATTIDLLKACGFTPNDDKSFGWGPYRESCGKEYYSCGDGSCTDISSIYWPRRDMSYETVGDPAESIDGSLLALANRIYFLEHNTEKEQHCHNYIRVWLTEKYHVSFVPEYLAYEGMLIGDTFDFKVKDLVTGNRLRVTADELEKHPEYRVLATTATKKVLIEAPNVNGCIHNQLTPEQSADLWDSIQYNEFLEYGPRYEDPLMELLHCSSPRLDMRDACLQTVCHFDTRYTL